MFMDTSNRGRVIILGMRQSDIKLGIGTDTDIFLGSCIGKRGPILIRDFEKTINCF